MATDTSHCTLFLPQCGGHRCPVLSPLLLFWSPSQSNLSSGAGGDWQSSPSPQGGKRRVGLSSQNPAETLAPQVHANEDRGINIPAILHTVRHTQKHTHKHTQSLYLVRIIQLFTSVLMRCNLSFVLLFAFCLLLHFCWAPYLISTNLISFWEPPQLNGFLFFYTNVKRPNIFKRLVWHFHGSPGVQDTTT